MFGFRSLLAGGEIGAEELAELSDEGVSVEDFKRGWVIRSNSSRRPIRFRAEQVDLVEGSDDVGQFLQVSFRAPAGSYGTSLVRELTKGEGC